MNTTEPDLARKLSPLPPPTEVDAAAAAQDTSTVWLVTLASGRRYWMKTPAPFAFTGNAEQLLEDHETSPIGLSSSMPAERELNEIVESTPLVVLRSLDMATKKVLVTRTEDYHVMVEPSPDSSTEGLIAQHLDGTRFTHFRQEVNQTKPNPDATSKSDLLGQTGGKAEDLDSTNFTFYRVEHPNFPPVLVMPFAGQMEVAVFGTDDEASRLTVNTQGQQVIQLGNGGELTVCPDGAVLYSSIPISQGHLQQSVVTTYGMRSHGESTLMEVIDPSGNAYAVDSFANCNVLLKVEDSGSLATETETNPKRELTSTDLSTKAGDQEQPRGLISIDEHIPRLFFIKPDRQGTTVELLRPQDIYRVISGAEEVSVSSSNMWDCIQPGELIKAGTKEKLDKLFKDKDTSNDLVLVVDVSRKESKIHGFTLMRPLPVSPQLPVYIQKDITPEGLVVNDLPQLEKQPKATVVTGVKSNFGHNAGRGLSMFQPKLDYIGKRRTPKKQTLFGILPTRRSCGQFGAGIHPTARFGSSLLVRRFVKYQPVKGTYRSRFQDTLHAYAQHVLNSAVDWCKLQYPQMTDNGRQSGGLAAAIFQASSGPGGGSDSVVVDSESRSTLDSRPDSNPASTLSDHHANDEEQVGEEQEELGAEKRNSDRSRRYRLAYEALLKEIATAVEDRAVLRDFSVCNYFRSKEGLNFLFNMVPNANRLAQRLSTLPAAVSNVKERPASTGGALPVFDGNKETLKEEIPCEIQSPKEKSRIKPCQQKKLMWNENKRFSSDCASSKKGDVFKRKFFCYYTSSLEYEEPEEKPPTPRDVMALKNYRRLRVPSYLYASRPHLRSEPNAELDSLGSTQRNLWQAQVDDPVRRRVLFTSLIAGPESSQMALRRCRGLRLQPSRLDCGRVEEGQSPKHFRVRLVNWGPETAYFRVESPPATRRAGIQVTYTPGPVPAGLSRDIWVSVKYPPRVNRPPNSDEHCLFHYNDEVATGSQVVHHLKLTTDTHIINFPVTCILSPTST